jgi:AcrR family transcriptional regulator
MSTSRAVTRRRILVATRRLLEERGHHGVALEEVAAASDLSRQAIYLHFGSKSGLLLALVEWVDEEEGLAELMAPVAAERDGVRALEMLIELTAAFQPRIHRLAMVLATARRTDEAVAAAWDDRMNRRRAGLRAVIGRIKRSGGLAPGWTVERATDLAWALTAPEAYDALVVDRGWSPAQWALETQRVVNAALVRSSARSTEGA